MGLIVNQNLINDETGKALEELCPFGAISYVNGKLDISSACRLCRMCVNKGPAGCVSYEEEKIEQIDEKETAAQAAETEEKETNYNLLWRKD